MENEANATVETLWEQIAVLTPDERFTLYRRMEEEGKQIYAERLTKMMQEMKARGMVRSEILPKRSGHSPKKLVVEGEPVSETIMRERR